MSGSLALPCPGSCGTYARAVVDSYTVLHIVSSTPQRTWTLEVDVDTTEDPVRCVTIVRCLTFRGGYCLCMREYGHWLLNQSLYSHAVTYQPLCHSRTSKCLEEMTELFDSNPQGLP